MIGCGKSELVRRLARIMHVPFVSFEATAFTSVGFVGADVRDIIKELYKCAVKIVNEDAEKAEKDALRRENMMKVLKLLNLAPTEKNIANYESGIWDDIRADVYLFEELIIDQGWILTSFSLFFIGKSFYQGDSTSRNCYSNRFPDFKGR